VPIQAFIDESGSKNQDAAFVLAGVIAKSERWADFSDDWQAVLNASPSIGYFKMYEAAKLKDQFGGWKAIKRDEKIKQLARVLNARCPDAISVSLDIGAFYQVMPVHMPKPANNPYFVAFHQMIPAVGFHLLDRGQKEKSEIIFDENVKFAPRHGAGEKAAEIHFS
jgi:hypothetical protein